ncbi:TonB-dependent siderophore receptor [Pseudomonas petrae]|uniref:TonB-dependent siderophore receptor n=1 Tax=Pseudomonas petrae TaxID=2912190 RepID=UPI001EF0154D|nr:TonB-dependent siderophore receptor [Pseudomonas petrae]MCF7534236.1 TonB-dependent siderophore receptor [Pseudomonas petrae]MCF7539722.1 TonB-dependent siderophore receptor [Pseudomonas petrae]MCF7558010.1 TonB-dependent siderophore receptor [Pseudomonas petrae]
MLRPALPALSALVALGFSSHSFAAPTQQDLPDQPSATSLTQPGSASGNSAPGAVALEGLSINADYGIAGQATTENSGSYTTGSMNTATQLPLSIRETPQSVSVITRQRMDDQGMNDLNDVVKYAPGVTLHRTASDRQEFLARGFKIDNIMYDGLPSSISTYTQDVISGADLAMYDRVEVVRGATGLMTGAGSPAATLNLVRKRLTAVPQVSVTTSAGSWDRYRTEVDASNTLNDSGTVRGRVVAAYEDDKSFSDIRKNQRQTFYGILEADLNDSTTWTVGASKQRDDNTSDWGGLPSGPNGEDLHLKRSTFLSNDWSYWNKDNIMFFTDVTHRFDNGWSAKLAGQKIWAEADTFSSYIGNYDGLGFQQYHGKYRDDDDQTNLDASLSGPFQMFGREHELVVGVSHRQEKFHQWGGWTDGTPIDIYNPPHSLPKPDVDTSLYETRNAATEEGVYAAARLNPIDPLHVILGSRVSWYDFDNRVGSGDYKVVREVTPYAGVIYDLNETYSAYASYTEIFKPQTEMDSSRSVLKPMTGKNYEIGLKGEYFDGALNASVALFEMEQENRAYLVQDQNSTNCPSFPASSCYGAAGKVRSRGIDTELSGALTPDWQFSASYTYVLSQFVEDGTKSNEGKLFAPEQPKHLFKTATSYTLPGELHKWRVGADVLAQSKTFNRVGDGQADQDAYGIVGLMAGYKLNEHWDGRVNVNNLFDTRYWQGIPKESGTGVYGDPRNLMFSVKWTL